MDDADVAQRLKNRKSDARKQTLKSSRKARAIMAENTCGHDGSGASTQGSHAASKKPKTKKFGDLSPDDEERNEQA